MGRRKGLDGEGRRGGWGGREEGGGGGGEGGRGWGGREEGGGGVDGEGGGGVNHNFRSWQQPTHQATDKQVSRLPPHLLVCPKLSRPYSQYDEYEKLLLKQCTSARFKLLPHLK